MKFIMQFTTFLFKDLAILDFRAIIHVFNNLLRFLNFQKTFYGDYLLAGTLEVPILGYGDVSVQCKNGKIFHLKKIVFCMDFITNLVSFRLLKANSIFWNTINNILF